MSDIRKLTVEIYWHADHKYEDEKDHPLTNALYRFQKEYYRGLSDKGFWDLEREDIKEGSVMLWEIDYNQEWPEINEDDFYEKGGV